MQSAKAKLHKSLTADSYPLNYSTTMRVIRDALTQVTPEPVVVSEGANTMDNARCKGFERMFVPAASCVHTMCGLSPNVYACASSTARRAWIVVPHTT